MRKLKAYLDTSVVSYLYQLDTPEKMKDTLELWELFRQGHYEVYISVYPPSVLLEGDDDDDETDSQQGF